MPPSGPPVPAYPPPLIRPSVGGTTHAARGPGGPGAGSHGEPLYGSLVGDIMVRDVVTVGPNATLRTAALLLSHKRISGLPVVEHDDEVIGVLSEKDIVRILQQRGGLNLPGGLFDLLLEPSGARQKDMLARCHKILDDTEVNAAMTSPAQTILPSAPTIEAIRRMVSSHINRLPVVENRRLVGIVTRRDVLAVHLEPT
jgi:CBS domain-containing protein